MRAEYLDHMGSDLSVVNAARVSFDKESYCEETRWVDMGSWFGDVPVVNDKDAKLIAYLAKHDHWTPFAHTSISIRMSAPVPIRTQCFKHKQGFVENEESRRYISSTPLPFLPKEFRSAPTGGAKQGSSGVHPDSNGWKTIYLVRCTQMINLYEEMIADGVCPEQARFVLPQGCEVQWIWTGNLYAFANFYVKRTDPHAQKEIQDLARMVGDIVEPLFPVSWKALVGEEA